MTPAVTSDTARSERFLPWLLLLALALITAYRGYCLYHDGLDLYVDEAQYWTWAQKLDWGYYSKPPVIAAVIALTTSVCGDGPFCVKSGALLLYPLSTLLLWALARRLFGGRTAFWCALAFLLLPGVSLSSLIISTDVPFFLFWTLALYAYWRGTENGAWGWWLLAGLAAGAGLLTKYTMVIFALSVLLHLALTPSLRRYLRDPRPYAASLVALLVLTPNLWWNARHGWPTLRHTEDISHLNGDAGLHWNHLGDFLGGQFAVMGPLFFGTWLALTLWRPRGWYADPRYRFLACFSLPFLGLISLQALLGRANANWGAMTYATATIFLVALLLQRGRTSLFAAGLAFNALLMPIAYHFDDLTRYFVVDLSARTDPYKRVRGWAQLCRQAQFLRTQYPQALFLGDSREVLAELMYYVQPHPLDAVLWNPHRVMDNHYALSTSMDDKLGRDFLYITEADRLPPEMLAGFDGVEALPPLHVTVHRDYALDYRAWYLQGFKGYVKGEQQR
ncbi:MAG: glycosyltransferase family 39 protein [Nevskia sp.]|nr:glycosyltransferase family 39 protein [Nevskia sp.]